MAIVKLIKSASFAPFLRGETVGESFECSDEQASDMVAAGVAVIDNGSDGETVEDTEVPAGKKKPKTKA